LKERQPAPDATSCGAACSCCEAPRPNNCCNKPNGHSDRAPSPRVRCPPRSNRKADTSSIHHSGMAPNRYSCL
jgi:hypothetical protein